MNLRKITAQQTYSLRHKVLRKHKDLSTCKFDADNDNTTLHYGVFSDSQLIAILSVYESHNPSFLSQNQLQLRAMAIDEDHQGQGLGKMLMNFVLKDLKTSKPNSDLIWCNARESAFRFYLKLGFNFDSEPFDIEDVGTHRVMSRSLSPLT